MVASCCSCLTTKDWPQKRINIVEGMLFLEFKGCSTTGYFLGGSYKIHGASPTLLVDSFSGI